MLRLTRRLLLPAAVLLCVLLCACRSDAGDSQSPTAQAGISVTVESGADDADIWILPQTEENLKSSIWGAPTASKLPRGAQKTVTLSDDAAGYIVRIIDAEGGYYAARDVALSDGCSIRFQEAEATAGASLTVLDRDGNTIATHEDIFQGTLGAE